MINTWYKKYLLFSNINHKKNILCLRIGLWIWVPNDSHQNPSICKGFIHFYTCKSLRREARFEVCDFTEQWDRCKQRHQNSPYLVSMQLPVCSVCFHLPGAVWGHEFCPCLASHGFCWALPVSCSWETKMCIQVLDLPFGTGYHRSREKQLFSTIQTWGALHSSPCAWRNAAAGRGRRDFTQNCVCTNTPDTLLNKFVVYSSDELLE